MDADERRCCRPSPDFEIISVYLRLSRSNVRFRGVSRIINHQELAEVIGTGFICGYLAVGF
jgi:hypothetical protein